MAGNGGTSSPPPPSSDSENGIVGNIEDGLRQLVLNNRHGFVFSATPEMLIMQILRRRVQGNLHHVPSSVLCYFRECDADNFFQLPEYYRRTANLYFCRRMAAAGGVEIAPVGWTRRDGPTEINNGEGRYATYQKINSRVTVTEYRFLAQQPNNETALYGIVAREF